jgi:hypothetical protein
VPLIAPFSLTVTADQIAYDWIIAELKRQNGVGEAIYAYDQNTSQVVACWHEKGFGGGLHPSLEAALKNGQPIVLHHNHPSSGSFIHVDLQTLVGLNPNHPNVPDLKEIWAHGKLGTRYRLSAKDPQYGPAILAADQYMTKHKNTWSICQFGHQIFTSSGWHHLVCLCLEAIGYVNYEYDVTSLPNYNAPTYIYDVHVGRLSMKDAFPLAMDYIISNCGHLF